MRTRRALPSGASIRALWEGVGLDPGDIQDKAVDLGVCKKGRMYEPKRHGPNDVGAEPGDEWYEFTDEMKAGIDAAGLCEWMIESQPVS